MVTMISKRLVRHLLMTQGQLKRCFKSSVIEAIDEEIRISERSHSGEICFVVEAALDCYSIVKNKSPTARAMELFSRMHLWDTENNSGLLIYVLLADRTVVILADRGIHAKVGDEPWQKICLTMENHFKKGDYEYGAIAGIRAVTEQVEKYFSTAYADRNEISNRPVLI
jgi:TPM domain